MRFAFLTSTTNRHEADRIDAPLIAALHAKGVSVTQHAWDDPTDTLGDVDAAVVRTTWNYQTQRQHFLDRLKQVADTTTLINPFELISWNTHKQYLCDLEDQGVPVVPTVVVPRGSDTALSDIPFAHTSPELVMKPAVGAGGRDVTRGTLTALADRFVTLNSHEDVVIQPYIDGLEHTGEMSVIVAAGSVTHAVNKLPAANDFRAHERYGAKYRVHDATPAERELAVWIVAQLQPAQPTFARIDFIRDSYGTLYVSEVELTEPNLYLDLTPTAAKPLADALYQRAKD